MFDDIYDFNPSPNIPEIEDDDVCNELNDDDLNDAQQATKNLIDSMKDLADAIIDGICDDENG